MINNSEVIPLIMMYITPLLLTQQSKKTRLTYLFDRRNFSIFQRFEIND